MNGVIHVASLPAGAIPVLDARELRDKDALLTAIGVALGFPDYFGGNWDALEECLTDPSWHEGPLRLALRHPEALEADTRETLLDIFQAAAQHWAASQREFALYLFP